MHSTIFYSSPDFTLFDRPGETRYQKWREWCSGLIDHFRGLPDVFAKPKPYRPGLLSMLLRDHNDTHLRWLDEEVKVD